MIDLYPINWRIHKEVNGHYKLVVIDSYLGEVLYYFNFKENLTQAIYEGREAHKKIWYNMYRVNKLLQ